VSVRIAGIQTGRLLSLVGDPDGGRRNRSGEVNDDDGGRWLSDRIDLGSVPDDTVVMDFDVTGTGVRRFWLVLEHGTAASVCIEDPCPVRASSVACPVHGPEPCSAAALTCPLRVVGCSNMS